MFTEFLVDLGCIDIADHDKGQVIWNVAGFVVVKHILAGELIIDVEIPDHRMAVRAFFENGIEHELGALAAGIIKSHGKLAADDFLFFRVFGFRQGRILHRIGQDFDSFRGSIRRCINPVNRAVERGVGIDVAATVLDLLGYFTRGAGCRPFE